MRTRSAAHPSRGDVSTEGVSDAVAAGGLLGISENSQQGRVRASVPRPVRSRQQPQASILLAMEGERDGRSAQPNGLPESTNKRALFFSGNLGPFLLLVKKHQTEDAERLVWAFHWMHV